MRSTERHFYWWDSAKAASNYRKHGVLFEDACIAIEDPLAATRHDVDRDGAEERWITLGEADGTLLYVVYTLDELDDQTHWVRIISARHSTPDERRQYETGKYRIQEAIMFNRSNPDQWIRGRFYSERAIVILPVLIAEDLVEKLNVFAKQRGRTPSDLANQLLMDALSQPPFVAGGADHPG